MLETDTRYYLECFCSFCEICFTTQVQKRLQTDDRSNEAHQNRISGNMIERPSRDHPNQSTNSNYQQGSTAKISCPFCKQQLSTTNAKDIKSDPKAFARMMQLNANPATMLKSTVRNIEFREKQMLAKNRLLQNKNGFLESLLKQVIRSGAVDIHSLPAELIEQDKFNFLGELRSTIEREVGSRRDRPVNYPMKPKSPPRDAYVGQIHHQKQSYPEPANAPGRRSKSEMMVNQAPNYSYRPTTNGSAAHGHYDGIFNARGSKSMRHTPANAPNSSAQFYGFEVRNVKKNPGTTGPRDSAQAIEERLSNLGHNPIVSMHNNYHRNKH